MSSTWGAVARARVAVTEVVRRFPLPIAMGALGAVAGSLLVAEASRAWFGKDLVTDLLLTLWLGVSLFLAAALAAERRAGAQGGARSGGDADADDAATGAATLMPGPRPLGWLWALAAAALLALSFTGLHGQRDEWRFIRFALWMIAVHGVVAILPVLPVGGRAARPAPGDFRAFNVMLFTRTVSALVITHVLYAGLAFALQAIHKLFDVEVPGSIYGSLWFGLVGIVNTVYVLAGIPRGWDRLAEASRPPALLDVIARWVLLPLSALYLAILYTYSARIVWMHEWPRGWVSAPIIVFSAVGLLTVLLLGPDGDRGTRFVRAYCKSFFVALMPLVVLLFMAIGRRAGEYGLTEERCLVYAIAVFLGVIAPYFVFSRRRRLASIPIVLGAIAILTSVGPLSATSLSLRSQTGRLREVLARNHLLDRAATASGVRPNVSKRDEAQLSGVLKYLEDRGQLSAVVATLGDARCAPCAGWRAHTPAPADLMASLGLTYRPWGEESSDDTTSYTARRSEIIETRGFDWLVDDLSCWPGRCRVGSTYNDDDLHRTWNVVLRGNELVVEHRATRLGTIPLDAIRARVEDAVKDDAGRRSVDPKLMTVEGEWPGGGYRLMLSNLGVSAGPGPAPVKVQSLQGRLLVHSRSDRRAE